MLWNLVLWNFASVEFCAVEFGVVEFCVCGILRVEFGVWNFVLVEFGSYTNYNMSNAKKIIMRTDINLQIVRANNNLR